MSLLRRSYLSFLCLALLLSAPAPLQGKDKPKVEKFRGSVVTSGPNAITVKSRKNIYLVRTFNYSPKLQKKIQRKQLKSTQRVTVHYYSGTNTAVKVDD